MLRCDGRRWREVQVPGRSWPADEFIYLHWDGKRWNKLPHGDAFGCPAVPDGDSGFVYTGGRRVHRHTADGQSHALPRIPDLTTLRGRKLRGSTDMYLEALATVPGARALWGVGTISHRESGNPWNRAGIIRYG